MPDTIHLVFKTHLDIGFTDYAANVVRKYHTLFIPQAIRLAAETRSREMRFRWTVGAWLIYDFLEQASAADRAVMERAIDAGDIVWHALPFTTHTELMDDSLFRFGLSYAQRLDTRFGRKTIAGKMTDVPGHSRAMVPLLAEAGIRLLHLGVNPVSAVPEVPSVFVWRDRDSETSICVVYDRTYGGVTRIDGMSDVLAVILTGDNAGPPSVQEVERLYHELRGANPGAQVIASTLDDFAARLWAAKDLLPVVTSEIGDTWIHGAGSDPTKVSQYRQLSRLRRRWLSRALTADERADVDAFSSHLVKVPEHTWGMDEKIHLPDKTRYTRSALAELRREPRTQAFERSWAEQRAYLTAAVDALTCAPFVEDARMALQRIAPYRVDFGSMTPVDSLTLGTDGIAISVDPGTGAVIGWSGQGDAPTVGPDHPLGQLSYTVYGSEDYDRYWRQYIRHGDSPENASWAREDNTKIGMPTVGTRTWRPRVTGLYRSGSARGAAALTFPDEARQFGAPAEVTLEYAVEGNALKLDLRWHDKPACRIAEAFWLSFAPGDLDPDAWRFEKLGHWIDPRDIASRGARTLHAVDQRVVCGERFSLTTLDAPLVAPGQPSLLDFHNKLPDLRGGVHVCLYNNVWGTNFPMWFEDDALFRFKLQFAAGSDS